MSIVNTSEITIAPRAPAATFAQTLRVDEAEVDERWRGSESKASGARRRVWGVIGRFHLGVSSRSAWKEPVSDPLVGVTSLQELW